MVQLLIRYGRAFHCLLLKCSSSGEQVEDKDNDGQDEEDVNPSAHCVAADQTENPEYEKNDGDRPKHVWLSFGREYVFAIAARARLRPSCCKLPVDKVRLHSLHKIEAQLEAIVEDSDSR
jgi:ABC-type Zn2+ transport system substrate-binding protein/surface adhesin